MARDRTETFGPFEVHKVFHRYMFRIHVQQIETVSVFFTAPASRGGRRPRMHDQDLAPRAFIHLGGVVDESPVQVPAQDQVHPRVLENRQHPLAARKGRLIEPVPRDRQVVVEDSHLEVARGRRFEGDLRKSQLALPHRTVHDRRARCRRVQRHRGHPRYPDHRIETVLDEAAIVAKRREETLEHAIEGHVVIARREDLGYVRQRVDEGPSLLILFNLGALREIPGQHDQVGCQVVRRALEDFSDPRVVGPSEMKVRSLQ